jgi:hypothetical protein
LFRYSRTQVRLEHHRAVARYPAPPFAEFHALTHGCSDTVISRSPKYDPTLS